MRYVLAVTLLCAGVAVGQELHDNSREKKPFLPAGRPYGSLARPASGVRHPRLNEAWAAYDIAVAEALAPIRDVIVKRFDTAAAKGSLEDAEKWHRVLTRFEQDGTVPNDSALHSMVETAIADLESPRIMR